MENTIIESMERMLGIKYSDEQKDVLNQSGGMCILACAGSGKTTVLTHLICKRILSHEIEDPERLMCTTFSKGGADEMSTRLNGIMKALRIRSRVKVKTLHAIYLKLIRDFGYQVNIIEQSRKMRFIREACKESGIRLEDDEYQTLDGLFGYQINNLLSDNQLFYSYVYSLREKIPLEMYSAIRTSFNRMKQSENAIDFDDMQMFVYSLLQNPNYGAAVQQYVHRLWDHIYIDEAQDISKIQFEILKYFVSDPSKLVVIGDDDQAIYTWRGADPSIILSVCGVYSNLTLKKLTTNYRCREEIIKLANTGVTFNKIRSSKLMGAYKPDGIVRVCDIGGGNLYRSSLFAYKHIRSLIINEKVNPNDIAVLARNNKHLTILGNMLFKSGVFCNMPTEIRMSGSPMFKMLNGIIELSKNTNSGQVTSANLWKLCTYMKSSVAKMIGTLQSGMGLKLSDIIALILNQSMNGEKLEYENTQFKIGKPDSLAVEAIYTRIPYQSIEDLKGLHEMLTQLDEDKRACGMLIKAMDGPLQFMFKGEDISRYAFGLAEYIHDLIQENGLDWYTRFAKLTQQFEEGGMAVVSPMVNLSTIHGAKGKEWKYVIIFAADNVGFPSFQSIRTYLDSNIPRKDIDMMIDEDRRLFYVACTRAIDELAIFTNKKNMTVYGLESFGMMEEYRNENINSQIVKFACEGNLGANERYAIENRASWGNGDIEIDVKDLRTQTEVLAEVIKKRKEEARDNGNGSMDSEQASSELAG